MAPRDVTAESVPRLVLKSSIPKESTPGRGAYTTGDNDLLSYQLDLFSLIFGKHDDGGMDAEGFGQLQSTMGSGLES